ncbi:MAG: hypothetical protein KBA60_07485 [Flavobacteriales bacterium]|jgi:hypothetical protein|nr:hypothetical protein [Flavobacteriales bacterium]HQV75728.1 hypothetical protein [Flavobacteriales bacterium]HQW40505.1 hypothetical protein [Flavobacteriales bacterium]
MFNAGSSFFRNTFLGRVVRTDRRVGYFLIAFALLQGCAQLFRAEVTPFFLYGMYSEVLDPLPTYVRTVCHVNGQQLEQTDLPRYAGEFLYSTLDRYQFLEANEGADLFAPFLDQYFSWLSPGTRADLEYQMSFHPNEKPAFERWLLRYLEHVLDEPITSIQIDRETYEYKELRPKLVLRERLIELQK